MRTVHGITKHYYWRGYDIRWQRFAEKESFKPAVEEWRGNGWWKWWVDELMEEVSLKELGEAELERLVRGWRRDEARSWFQRRGEAYWKERSAIRREDDVDGRASVTKDEERMLRGGWAVMRLYRYEGWVVVRTLSVTLSHPRERKSTLLSDIILENRAHYHSVI